MDEKLFDDSRIRPLLFEQIKRDSSEALRLDAGNFKAYYRRALACYELGELTLALRDAVRVLEHYNAKNMQNPDALKLKEKIAEAVRLLENSSDLIVRQSKRARFLFKVKIFSSR